MTIEERIVEIKRRYLLMGGYDYKDNYLLQQPINQIMKSSATIAINLGNNEYHLGLLADDLELQVKELQNKNKELQDSFPTLKTDRDTLAVKLLKEENEKLKDKNKELTRLEVIDESGRVYINNNCKMELSYQDEGRTLKIFVNNKGVK